MYKCDICKKEFGYILDWFEPFHVCIQCSEELIREMGNEVSIFQELRAIEFYARKVYGYIVDWELESHLAEEVMEMLSVPTDSNEFVYELIDVFAMGYAVAINKGMTHQEFVKLVEEKLSKVKSRMIHGYKQDL